MTEDAKKKIQLALAVVIVIAGARAGYILYQRHEDYVAAQKQQAVKNLGYSNQIITSLRKSCILTTSIRRSS
jgi:hypothetical protein